jgi:hypothetical protein
MGMNEDFLFSWPKSFMKKLYEAFHLERSTLIMKVELMSKAPLSYEEHTNGRTATAEEPPGSPSRTS